MDGFFGAEDTIDKEDVDDEDNADMEVATSDPYQVPEVEVKKKSKSRVRGAKLEKGKTDMSSAVSDHHEDDNRPVPAQYFDGLGTKM